MNPKLVVFFALLSIVAADDSVGLLGEAPYCEDTTNLLPGALDVIVDKVGTIPCNLLTCLLNFTCEDNCDSQLITLLSKLGSNLVQSGTCFEGSVCPENLAVETCLQETLGDILGFVKKLPIVGQVLAGLK